MDGGGCPKKRHTSDSRTKTSPQHATWPRQLHARSKPKLVHGPIMARIGTLGIGTQSANWHIGSANNSRNKRSGNMSRLSRNWTTFGAEPFWLVSGSRNESAKPIARFLVCIRPCCLRSCPRAGKTTTLCVCLLVEGPPKCWLSQ